MNTNTDKTLEQIALAKERMKTLFVAPSAKPTNLKHINLRKLTPFHRALLAIDGTVTQFIEAYTLSPVEIVLLNQETCVLPDDNIWLEAAKGTAVVERQVLLQSEGHALSPFAYAVSLIIHNRLPKSVRDGLVVDGEGLGKLLRRSELESRRDLLWCGLEHPKDLPEAIDHLEGEPFLSRTYRIVVGGQPTMLINEKFPLGESANKKSKARSV